MSGNSKYGISGYPFKIMKVEDVRLAAIAEFLYKQKHCEYNKQEWLNKFNLFWDSNPWFDEKKHNRGWIIINTNQEIHGFLGSIPVVYLRKGKPEDAFCATTWVVSKQARGQSLKLYQKYVEQSGCLLSTTTEPKVQNVITYLFGYEKIEPTWIKYNYILPLSLAQGFKFITFHYKNNIVKRNVAKLGCVFSKILASTYIFFECINKSKIKVTQCKIIPVDIEHFNEKLILKYKYIFPRDRKTTEWLYFSGTQSLLRLFLEVRDGTELIGFISFKCMSSHGVARVELIDFVLLYTTRTIIKKIIIKTQMIVKTWRRDAAFITLFSFNETMAAELVKAGFVKRKSENSFFIRPHPLNSSMHDFYTTPVDGDRPFFP